MGFYLVMVLMCAMSATWGSEGQEGIIGRPEYVYPIDGASVHCPYVSLKGKILRHTFPGVPNYESLENGDAPETRWVLEISESEIQRLVLSGFIPHDEIFSSEARGWVQLIAPCFEEDPVPFLNRNVIIDGYLGSLIFHVHTPIAIEAKGIHDDE